MALDAELLGLKSAGTYRFERDLSTISNDTTTYSNLRLVVGFSKTGPFNTPTLVTNQADFIKLYGNIDRSLEKKGSYFHRSALVALSVGPILCLNLLKLDPDTDQVQEKTLSVNVKDKNKYTTTLPLSSVFNTDKFWYASDESFLDAIDKYFGSSSVDEGSMDDRNDWTNGVLHFTNIGKKPISILVKKASAYNSKGFELTLNDWYGAENVPEYLNGTSYVSDYLVEVYVIGGDFGPELDASTYDGVNFDADGDGQREVLTTYKPSEKEGYVENPYKRFTSDINYQSYFDQDGFIRKENVDDKTDTKLVKFLNLPSVNLLAKYVGSLIPNFVDKLGRNIWIQKLVNDDVNTIGLLCAEDVTLLESVDVDEEYGIVNEKVDIIGNNIFNSIVTYKENGVDNDTDTPEMSLDVEMLSYKYSIEDAMQSFTVNISCIRGIDEDSDDIYDDCGLMCDDETEHTFVRLYNGAYDIDDINGTPALHPYAWLLKNSDGTLNPNFALYTDSTSIPNDSSVHYAYGEYDSDESVYTISNVSTNKSVIVEHTSYDADETMSFTEKNEETYNTDSVCELKENEVILATGSVTVGDYLVSHWKNSYDTELDILGLERFSRLTRVVRTSTIYGWVKNASGEYEKSESKLIKVVCSDKIHRTARKLANNAVVQIRTVDSICDRLHWICLKGFKMSASSMPNGTNERQNEILDMLRETPIYSSTVSNLFRTLIDRDYIQWRYLVDTFGLGIEEESKSVYTQLCQERKSAFAIINCPSQSDFKKSIDPSFVNKMGGVEVEHIANGGDLDKNPVFLYTLPSIENGASWGAYYYPYLRISDLSAVKSVPPAAYVSNLFIQKYGKSNAWSIVAGQKRGVISGNQVIGVEATLIHENRDWLEPVGINSIIWENGVGVEVYANKTAKQTPLSALSSIHVRECCIYIQDNVETILRRYVFEYNTAQTRLEIKTLVDEFLENVKNNGGVYDYKTVMDTSNNTQEVIDNNTGVIDIYIEPVRGLEKLVQRLTVMKTGGIVTGAFE